MKKQVIPTGDVLEDDLRRLKVMLSKKPSDLCVRQAYAQTLAHNGRFNDAWTCMWDGYEFRKTEFWDKDVSKFLDFVGSNLYKELEFEVRAPRDDNEDKELYSADESLKRCIKNGFDGHPLSAQVFSFLIANARKLLDRKEKRIASDMLDWYGEWFGLAEEHDNERVDGKIKNFIVYYEHPTNFHYRSGIGLCFSEMSFAKARKFSFAKRESSCCNEYSLDEVVSQNPDLVLYHWSQQFDSLPDIIQSDAIFHCSIGLSSEIRPVGRNDNENVGFSVNCDYYIDSDCGEGASRGVRRAKR